MKIHTKLIYLLVLFLATKISTSQIIRKNAPLDYLIYESTFSPSASYFYGLKNKKIKSIIIEETTSKTSRSDNIDKEFIDTVISKQYISPIKYYTEKTKKYYRKDNVIGKTNSFSKEFILFNNDGTIDQTYSKWNDSTNYNYSKFYYYENKIVQMYVEFKASSYSYGSKYVPAHFDTSYNTWTKYENNDSYTQKNLDYLDTIFWIQDTSYFINKTNDCVGIQVRISKDKYDTKYILLDSVFLFKNYSIRRIYRNGILKVELYENLDNSNRIISNIQNNYYLIDKSELMETKSNFNKYDIYGLKLYNKVQVIKYYNTKKNFEDNSYQLIYFDNYEKSEYNNVYNDKGILKKITKYSSSNYNTIESNDKNIPQLRENTSSSKTKFKFKYTYYE